MKQLFFISLFTMFALAANAQEQFSVYFDTNKHELDAKELAGLKAWVIANKTSKIVGINGYTDEDGSVGLNDSLGQRRVDYVFGVIRGKVNIRSDFSTRNFGKLHKHESVKAKNRKATIYYLLEKDIPRENEILGIKDEPRTTKKEDIVYASKIKVRNPDGKEEEMTLDLVFMKKLGTAKVGDKVKIPNLNYYRNTYALVKESRPNIYSLLEVMKMNPGLKIKLQGHICCSPTDRNKLSYDRAKSVMMFLTQNGIEKSRVNFEGLGTTQPIYAIPEKTDEEREANRRVEVLVMAND